MMVRAGSKDGCSDPLIFNGIVSDHKISYDRDNSVIFSKSPYRWKGLRPQHKGRLFNDKQSQNWLYAGISGESLLLKVNLRKSIKVRTIRREVVINPSTTTRQLLWFIYFSQLILLVLVSFGNHWFSFAESPLENQWRRIRKPALGAERG